MTTSATLPASAVDHVGEEMYALIRDLFPICRSLTGDGVRETLRILRERIPLEIHEIATGTRVFDWTAPQEWNIRDAYVKGPGGERIIDFARSNLHVMGYSIPVRATVSRSELSEHVFTLPDHPDWIPYRTSYYKQSWAFCLDHRTFAALPEGQYEVVIDASLVDGHLTLGECFVAGASTDEVLISTHVCHPSLANDNLSGIALAVTLARWLARTTPRYSYRFLFLPGTIGAITWLSRNEARVSRIKHGLVLANVGDPGRSTYKRSRRHNAEIDRACAHVLKQSGQDHEILDFSPYGYDERQFCSPGFDLPVGCFMRTPHGRFPEYHTSADNLTFVQPRALADSYTKMASVLRVLEGNATYLNLNPKCEPQLGRRGLYGSVGGQAGDRQREIGLLWVLNLSNGQHSLLDIAERSNLEFDTIRRAADLLLEHKLLKSQEG